ncbi:hypothetical protein AVEN_268201-1 [Araneus ventricosus]|uniref:Uncharacterized protein n=1 Tax=Araneus ventricosus TaxID=182803 RepID=A0A4Y2U4L0_ARAVE|nr:hypothetical protein AVEN_268201-1 [Araneus ventricosus]
MFHFKVSKGNTGEFIPFEKKKGYSLVIAARVSLQRVPCISLPSASISQEKALATVRPLLGGGRIRFSGQGSPLGPAWNFSSESNEFPSQVLLETFLLSSVIDNQNPCDEQKEPSDNDRSEKGPTSEEAFRCLETAVRWLEQPKESDALQMLL